MNRPFIVGIAGGTGSGKTTVAERLLEALPAGQAALLQHDSYYRSRVDLSFEQREQLNFDHPSSLESDLLHDHLRELLARRSIEVPIYDYATHLRQTSTRRVEPAPVVLVEGILLLSEPNLRELFDLKVYVDTDADIRIIRRIERDLLQRKRSFVQVRDQYYSTVRPMHLQFVEPSKRYADVVIPEGGHNEIALQLIVALLMSRVTP
jgi:uridine kinase